MITLNQQDSWVNCYYPRTETQLRLFCFPYAGGTAAVYREWGATFPETVEVCAIQLPGRGNRFAEAAFTHLPDLIDTLTNVLLPYFDEPFALFGHSMGALIGFELARQLRRECDLLPEHLFVSGRAAAQLSRVNRLTYTLPDAQFVTQLQGLNGMPDSIVQDEELLRLVLPTIRADVELCETYTYIDEAPLSNAITALGGQNDVMASQSEIAAWSVQTDSVFKQRTFAGDHFFLHSAQTQVLQTVRDDLVRALRRVSVLC